MIAEQNASDIAASITGAPAETATPTNGAYKAVTCAVALANR